jgi:hypothetical protein
MMTPSPGNSRPNMATASGERVHVAPLRRTGISANSSCSTIVTGGQQTGHPGAQDNSVLAARYGLAKPSHRRGRSGSQIGTTS